MGEWKGGERERRGESEGGREEVEKRGENGEVGGKGGKEDEKT